MHKNATLTPRGRGRLVRRVQAGEVSVSQAALEAGVSRTTVYRWLRREEFSDRSSRPRRLARLHPRAVRRRVERGRKRRWSSLRIARAEGLPVPTVVTMLRRWGLNRLPPVRPPEPVQRYERAHAGELLHIDVKKLARIVRPGHRIHGNRHARAYGAGWEFVHIAIDDASRLAYAELLPDERADTATAFFARAIRWYRRRRIRIQELLTDNGNAYRSRQHRALCQAERIQARFTRPYRPQTNGKAERFIRTLLTEWAYARAYHNSARRKAALATYLHHYNAERPHGGIGFITPQQRMRACR